MNNRWLSICDDSPVCRAELTQHVGSIGNLGFIGYVILIGNRALGLNSKAPHLKWRSASRPRWQR